MSEAAECLPNVHWLESTIVVAVEEVKHLLVEDHILLGCVGVNVVLRVKSGLRHKGVDVLRGVRSNYRGGLMILLNGSTGGH